METEKVTLLNLETENIFFLRKSGTCSFSSLCEATYLSRILEQLHATMGGSFNDFDFFVISETGPVGSEPFEAAWNDKPRVLFYLSNETPAVPEHLSHQYHAIFKNYLPLDRHKNIYSLPLGYVQDVTDMKPVDIDKRPNNIFFSGHLYYRRMEFFMQLTYPGFLSNNAVSRLLFYPYNKSLSRKLNTKYPSSYLRFTNGFRSGLSGPEYAEMLYNSKIALCPRGYKRNETFRHFEAMRAGCIIISDTLPSTFYYKDSPIIISKQWSKLDKTIHSILNDPDRMRELSAQTRDWWDSKCSERAVARYIASRIGETSKTASSAAGSESRQKKYVSAI